MKRLLTIAALLAITAARPETYKETEDFNYQRSSSDDGSKAGFYNAQRGNMGGNYERAHNMDGLAQHQMSTAVKQVEGELGEASKMQSGQVFTSAQSGGMFGSGHYDLSNLQGRNFHENSYGAAGSQSHSALSSHQSAFNDHLSSSAHNSGYNSLAQNSGSRYGVYQGTKVGQSLDSSNLQAMDDVQGVNYGYGTHGAATRHSSGVSSQSGYHSAYENSNANQYGTHSAYGAVPQNRLIYTSPVRVYGRPGSRVAVPVGVQTYDATHSAATMGHSATALDYSASTIDHASTVDQNAINTEAEVLNTGDQHIVGYKPTSNAKHYESSYNYRKQWEKHDVKPEVIALAIPTESPFPENSELYDDAQVANNQYHASGVNSHSGYLSSIHNAHNSNVKTLSASQLHQSAIDSQQAASMSNLNAQTHGVHNSANSANTANVLSDLDTKPKSYQSSYSYHKAWERQGDPYVIKPVGGAYTNLDSQSLTDATSHQGYNHKSGSNYRQTNQGYTHHSSGVEDCDSDGYRRVARSVRNSQGNDDLTQQSQTSWRNVEDLEQQAQNSWDISESLRQAPYHQHAQVQQQAQQNHWDNEGDLGQQTQNSWDRSDALRQAHNYQHGEVQQQVQQKQLGNLEDLGQQTQNSWDGLDALRQAHNHQNTQTQQNELGKLEDLGQVQQNSWDMEDLTQQTQQHKWNSQSQSGQEIVNTWPGHTSEFDKSESEHAYKHQDQESNQMTQAASSDFNQEQQSQSSPLDDLDQQRIQQGQEFLKYPGEKEQGQQSQSNTWDNLGQQQEQHTYFKYTGNKETEQQANENWGALEYSAQHKYSNQHEHVEDKLPPPVWLTNGNEGHLQQSSSSYHHNQHSDTGSSNSYDWSQTSADKTGSDFSQLGSLWDKIGEVDGQFSASNSQMGREYQNNLNVNQGKNYGIQNTTVLTPIVERKPKMNDNSTIETDSSTSESPKVNRNSRNDIGRGDIGPEEDLVEENPLNTLQESRPKSLITDTTNTSHVGNHHAKENNNKVEEERRNHQFHNFNSTQHSLWEQENYSFENIFKNQTTLHSSHQNGFTHNRTETGGSHIYNKNYTNNVEETPNFNAKNQYIVPKSLNNNTSKSNSDNTTPKTSVQFTELEPTELQQHQQNMFKFDEVPAETQQKQRNMFKFEEAPAETQQIQQNMFKVDEASAEIQQHQQNMFKFDEAPAEIQQHQQNMFKVDEESSEIQQHQQNIFKINEAPAEIQQHPQNMFKTYEAPAEIQQHQQNMFKIDEVKIQQQQQSLFQNDEESMETQHQQHNMFDIAKSPVEIQQQQEQHILKVDAANIGNLNQNSSHNFQQAQTLNDNENILRHHLEQPVQVTQLQKTENFKKDPQELDDIYRNSHNLQHYNDHQSKQAQLQSTETSNIVQDAQIVQNTSTVEPLTEKPGIFKRFKNKFMSLFSKTDNSDKPNVESEKK